jgi:3-deoxy-D-manno-octulosonic-acid transferase
VGPHTYNFAQAATDAIAAGAALRVEDAAGALTAADVISRDAVRREAMGQRAEAFVSAHRGAVQRLLEWIEPRLA